MEKTENGKTLLSPDEAMALFHEGEYVHTQYDSGCMLIGADRSRADLKKTLEEAVQIEIGGPACRAAGHGIAVWEDERTILFVQHDKAKLNKLLATMEV
jgi:hypothetical protein